MSLTSTVGEAVVDIFEMSASGWKDDHMPLTYKFFIKQAGVEKVLCESMTPKCSTPLPVADEKNDYKMQIYLTVLDMYFGKTTINDTIIVSILNGRISNTGQHSQTMEYIISKISKKILLIILFTHCYC